MNKVSVIIPTFGKPIFLKKAIQSVLDQTLDNVELIVVDDNNPDTEERVLTESIVNTFDDNIIYLKHISNKNGSVARNTGIAAAKGKYISFLDSDDEYHQDRLKKCYYRIEKCNSLVAGVYTGCEFRKNGKKYHINNKIESGNFLVDTLACKFKLSTGSNLFIRRSVINELNGFDEMFLRHQDYEFLVRLFKKYSLEAISEVLVIKNNENINLPDVIKILDVKTHFLEKYKPIIEVLQENDENYVYYSHYTSIAEHALKTKQMSLARNYYIRAKEYRSLNISDRVRKTIFTLLNFLK